jgi:hypothetical protein
MCPSIHTWTCMCICIYVYINIYKKVSSNPYRIMYMTLYCFPDLNTLKTHVHKYKHLYTYTYIDMQIYIYACIDGHIAIYMWSLSRDFVPLQTGVGVPFVPWPGRELFLYVWGSRVLFFWCRWVDTLILDLTITL